MRQLTPAESNTIIRTFNAAIVARPSTFKAKARAAVLMYQCNWWTKTGYTLIGVNIKWTDVSSGSYHPNFTQHHENPILKY